MHLSCQICAGTSPGPPYHETTHSGTRLMEDQTAKRAVGEKLKVVGRYFWP